MPRSGLGREYKVKLDNTIGLIDSDYRGVIGVALTNTGDKELIIDHGMRICQMAILPHLGKHNAEVILVDSLDESIRGENGWGSSGV
jgi:dUTP pyrophosphatase